MIKHITRETKLQDIQYKLLHNIYPTISHLKKWNIRESDICERCKVEDNLRHNIFECYYSKATWSNFSYILKTEYNISLPHLTYEDILIGLSRKKADIDTKNNALDNLILRIKREIILQRENKYVLQRNYISKLVTNELLLENITTKNDKKNQRKWRHFVSRQPCTRQL